jgi:hypothetical protein
MFFYSNVLSLTQRVDFCITGWKLYKQKVAHYGRLQSRMIPPISSPKHECDSSTSRMRSRERKRQKKSGNSSQPVCLLMVEDLVSQSEANFASFPDMLSLATQYAFPLVVRFLLCSDPWNNITSVSVNVIFMVLCRERHSLGTVPRNWTSSLFNPCRRRDFVANSKFVEVLQ